MNYVHNHHTGSALYDIDTSRISIFRILGVALVLAVLVLTVYFQVFDHSFINYDDRTYVTHNANVKKGLSIDNLKWAFSTTTASNWHPVTWLSHMLDVQLFGLNAGAHHMTNVFFHFLNAVLLFFVLLITTQKSIQSFFVAALFAVHPLHVESVAWVAERKDVLSTFWGLLATICYVRYVKQQRFYQYLLLLMCYGLSLMSKPMWVTLPFVFLLLDYWPLERITHVFANNHNALRNSAETLRRLVIEKIPLFVCMVMSCIITFVAQSRGGAVGSVELFPVSERIANALIAYVHYLAKMLWPTNLSIIYPFPPFIPFWRVFASVVILIALTFLVVATARRHPYIFVGWFWYLGTLVPVIGFVQIGSHSMADRYTYVPLIGIFMAVVWGVCQLLAGRQKWRWVLPVLAMGLILTLTLLSFKQVRHWKNSEMLFKHAVDTTEGNWIALNNLGHALSVRGRHDEALHYFHTALEINPNSESTQINLALSMMAHKQYRQAEVHLTQALTINPDSPQLHYLLANALFYQGNIKEAIRHYISTTQMDTTHAGAYYNLGVALMRTGRQKDAVAAFENTLRLDPDNKGALRHLNRYSKNTK